MYIIRRKTNNNNLYCNKDATNNTNNNNNGSSSKLFRPGVKILVQRASFIPGLPCPVSRGSTGGLQKKFQRPMVKRRAYNKNSDLALKRSSLGQKRRFDGMAKLMARAGRGLTYKLPGGSGQQDGDDSSTSSSDDENEKEDEKPFEPLMVWPSPHLDGKAVGLPPKMVTEVRHDEYGIEETVTVLKPAPKEAYSKQNVFVPAILAKWLRPHQREGVQFMYECVMGLRTFQGNGCILADDMGLGKTLQSVTLIYTLLKTSITAKMEPTAKRVIVICPCSLVKNWDNEFIKWLGAGAVKTIALAEADKATVEKNIDVFVKTKMFNILIASYECVRAHINRFVKHPDCCDLLVCDEAHRLKNNENQTSKALNSLPVKRRVLLTGTPMQNDLQEFYAMVNFTNPGILGTQEEFRRNVLFPILRGREPDATTRQKEKMMEIQNDMSTTVNEFILRRVNTLNAQHLPPKLVQVVCCNLTEIQQNMYQHLINSKDMQHVLVGKQSNCLGSIQMLMKLCNHPSLIADDDPEASKREKSGGSRRAAAKKAINYNMDDGESAAAPAPGAAGISRFLPCGAGGGGGGGGFGGRAAFDNNPVYPEWSGKMFVLYRLMKEMRKPGNGNDKIVIVSNYTQTLDLIGKMCRQNSWGFCRLDGSITMKKRQKMVDEFNDPSSSLVAFLLSSKAGGCGLNLIGGNRLVLFDPDWNPAVDKQAAARCWRDGQKKRCFTYRFLATGTVEEKIFQRQLSKEGLQSVVDDKEQVNALSTKDLRNLFKLRTGTPSDTHDKLKCERCKIIHDNAELEAMKVLPKKLKRCYELLQRMMANKSEHNGSKGDDNNDDADDIRDLTRFFLKPTTNPEIYGRGHITKVEYEKLVKQPMDLTTIKNKLHKSIYNNDKNYKSSTSNVANGAPSSSNNNNNNNMSSSSATYKSVSEFSKDVNRIFSNVLKVWTPEEDDIADAARRLQHWWIEQWTELVPVLMSMKSDNCDHNNDSDDEAHDDTNATEEERGDDYQEQIGMPDEENMRNWSHHHTTDTVDDPIFRAAMKGYDAVSFVFGLEVTWSLIQQRQQEEEERLAMMELERIQEEEEDQEEDAVEKKEDKDEVVKQEDTVTTLPAQKRKGKKVVEDLDDDELDSEEENDIDVEEESEQEMAEESSDDDENDDNDHMEGAEDDNDDEGTRCDEVDNVPAKEESTTSRQNEENCSVIENNDVTTDDCARNLHDDEEEDEVEDRDCGSTVASTSTATTNASAASSSSSVSASHKNNDNDDGYNDCDKKENIPPPLSATTKTTTTSWTCPVCTLINEKRARKCSACDTRRPRDASSSCNSSFCSTANRSSSSGKKKRRKV